MGKKSPVVALIIMLSIIPSTMSYQAPLATRSVSTVQMSAITPGDVGTTKPLGVYDPLQLMTKNPKKYRRFQEMEIKHGRFSMAACLHVFLTEAGVRWPGYLSFAEDIKFSDMPGGTIASWAALPGLSWVQIVLIVALFDKSGVSGKEFKLNAERNTGRAAMMGISGMVI